MNNVVLVCDQSKLVIPTQMGNPADGQMLGTLGERLSELAGRICYDSLGAGRNSDDYHKHIVEVGHGSVLEHYNVTVSLPETVPSEIAYFCRNRPGVFVGPEYVTLNLRSMLEWSTYGPTPYDDDIFYALCDAAPKIICASPHHKEWLGKAHKWPKSRIVEPEHEESKWLTFYIKGSRGFSHELVRHKWRTAVSQRSTRYCDETLSDWVMHPRLEMYLGDALDEEINNEIANVETDARNLYTVIVERLQKWLVSKGVTKLEARKQARGAARGYLGNALQTELIFSASVAQWKRIIRQRACVAADDEIRKITCQIFVEILKSRYASDFINFDLCDSQFGPFVVEKN